MLDKLTIIKIGGNVLDDATALPLFLSDFAHFPGWKILVHGGGKKATALSKQLGLSPQLVEGRRITTAADLEVATMVYAGLLNKNIVARLQALRCNALGLTGADGNTIMATKRPVGTTDFGWVGDITKVQAPAIQALLKSGFTPVFCALTHDGTGQLLNTNADTIAAELAIALSTYFELELLYCFEKKGVLSDRNEEKSVISVLDFDTYTRLKSEKTIDQGMVPKLENAFRALKMGVKKVMIGHPELLANPGDLHTTLYLKQ